MTPLVYLKLAGAAALVAAVVGYGEWRAMIARQDAETRALRAYIQTMEDINDADIPTDPNAVVKRLCELAAIDCGDL